MRTKTTRPVAGPKTRNPTATKRGKRTIKEIAPDAPALEAIGGDREQWLSRAAHLMWGWVVQAAAWEGVAMASGTPPQTVRCSWPPGRVVRDLSALVVDAHGGASIVISPVVGAGWHEWDAKALKGTHDEIACRLILHELCHLAAGSDAGHGREFASLAQALGFARPLPSAIASEPLLKRINDEVIARLGSYPHASERPAPADVAGHRKQRQRRGAYACERCGRKIAASRGLAAIHCCEDGGQGRFIACDPAFES